MGSREGIALDGLVPGLPPRRSRRIEFCLSSLSLTRIYDTLSELSAGRTDFLSLSLSDPARTNYGVSSHSISELNSVVVLVHNRTQMCSNSGVLFFSVVAIWYIYILARV